MDRFDSTVKGRLSALADELAARSVEITADVQEAIALAIPDFAADADLTTFRAASIGQNVDAMVHMVRVGLDAMDVAIAPAALEYARQLAHKGAPPAVIVRCYRAGQSRFMRHCLEALSRQELEAGVDARQFDNITSIALIDQISDFIDRVLDRVLHEYEDARRGELGEPAASVAADLDHEISHCEQPRVR